MGCCPGWKWHWTHLRWRPRRPKKPRLLDKVCSVVSNYSFMACPGISRSRLLCELVSVFTAFCS